MPTDHPAAKPLAQAVEILVRHCGSTKPHIYQNDYSDDSGRTFYTLQAQYQTESRDGVFLAHAWCNCPFETLQAEGMTRHVWKAPTQAAVSLSIVTDPGTIALLKQGRQAHDLPVPPILIVTTSEGSMCSPDGLRAVETFIFATEFEQFRQIEQQQAEAMAARQQEAERLRRKLT